MGGWCRGGNEKPTFQYAEKDASRSEDADDGVDGNEIGYYASIDREAGVINKGGYPTGVESITGMVLNLEGKK